MKYFKIEEFTYSATAKAHSIANVPTAEAVNNLTRLVNEVLDPIREQWGLPIRVTSGYRCPALNDEVNGVEDSYHMDGYAADISATDPERNVELMSLIRAMHLTGRISLTECYLGPKARYIHIACDPSRIDPFPFI